MNNMLFSQRIGISPVSKLVQREAIDNDLRNSLWNLLTGFYWDTCKSSDGDAADNMSLVKYCSRSGLVTAIWLNYFKKPIDTIDPYWGACLYTIRQYFFSAKWFQIYDFIEYTAQYGPAEIKSKFIKTTNIFLERENSAYRFVGDQITEITSSEEIEEVETSLRNSDKYAGVKIHLTTALALLSNRKNPDYRNSIKESISAIESLAKQLSKNETGTLGTILKKLETTKKLHPALKSAFSSLYGYSSDSDGIRHALLDKTDLTKAEARFMLICCSAFINYLIETIGI